MYTPTASAVLWIQVLASLYTHRKKTLKADLEFSSKERKLLSHQLAFTEILPLLF